MVNTSNSLGEYIAHFQHLQLGASCLVFSLVNCVGHDHFVECAGVDAIDRITTQNAVRDERIYLSCTFLLQQLRGTGYGVGGIGEIVDENGSAVCDVSDQHHGSVLSVVDLRGAAFLVDEREGHTERIGDSSRTLGTTSVGTDHDSVQVVGNIELDVFAEQMAAVKVVHGDVEEALILRI